MFRTYTNQKGVLFRQKFYKTFVFCTVQIANTIFQSGKIGVERPGLEIKNYMLMEISKDA